jgi:XTP/dITP diphosphohydrolase
VTGSAESPRPPASDPEGRALLDFLHDMRLLRRECPWKREQTHRSLARYLQEETYETLEAIDTGDVAHLREELGDLLLQIYFHAVIAEEEGTFGIDDVARGISEKMHRRNPHVFGGEDPTSLSAAEVDARWQEIKVAERTRRTPYDGIAIDLPALLLATKVLERTPEVAERVPPIGPDADLGDRILALVVEARASGVDPEQALRDAVRRAASL